MDYISTKEYAAAHGVAERTVRNYGIQGKIAGAQLVGKTWNLPADAPLPQRKNAKIRISPLLKALHEQKDSGIKGGIYNRTQIELTSEDAVKVDDIIETTNHFRCIDFIIDQAKEPLTETMITRLHSLLKSGTSDASKSWFVVGVCKRIPNEVGGKKTTSPQKVWLYSAQMGLDQMAKQVKDQQRPIKRMG